MTSFPPPARARSDSDGALVRRARDGDLSAFEELVARHRDVAVRVAGRIVGSEDAEDVSQDAFLRAFHRLAHFRGDASFRSWLLRIVHNAALDHQSRRRPDPVDPATLPEQEEMPGGRLPAERLEMRERIERLEGKLRALAPAHRSVLVLRDVEGFSYEEIAEIAEMPLGSVKGRLSRARQEFIEMLRHNSYDWELPR